MGDDDHMRAPQENAMPTATSGEPSSAKPTPGDDQAASGLPRFDLRAAFIARQQQLLADLGLSRTVTDHPGTLGDATELDWTGMLQAVLPQRYGVARAFVVDANQRRSEQLDVVIHDRHFSPLLFEVGGARFIPAEGVYAVLEVKQKINKEQVEYAAKKIASVRRLTRTSAPIPHAGGVYEPRPLPRILGGVLTLDSDWSPLFGDPLRQALTARNEDEALDLGCVLRHGGFEAPDPSRPGSLAATDKETAVIFFTLRLLKRLQAMATVPAINYDAYAATVWP
jgi:hypothetical protein